MRLYVVERMDTRALIRQQSITDAKEQRPSHACLSHRRLEGFYIPPRGAPKYGFSTYSIFLGIGLFWFFEEVRMCLAIPMQVREIDNFTARCEAKQVFRDVSLFMLQDQPVAPGDYVLVHVGYAIQVVSEEEALSAWEIFDQILAQEDA